MTDAAVTILFFGGALVLFCALGGFVEMFQKRREKRLQRDRRRAERRRMSRYGL